MRRLGSATLAWALGLALMGCGGSAQNGPPEVTTEAQPRCVESRFGMAPRDQGLTPPGARVVPGSVPEADCSEGPDQ